LATGRAPAEEVEVVDAPQPIIEKVERNNQKKLGLVEKKFVVEKIFLPKC
jgi:hypothetical protein